MAPGTVWAGVTSATTHHAINFQKKSVVPPDRLRVWKKSAPGGELRAGLN